MRTVVIPGSSRYARLRLAGYYVQRAVTSRRARNAATQLVAAALGRLHPAHKRLPPQGAAHAGAMRETGYALLGSLLAPQECAAIHAWLRGCPLVDARGSGRTFLPDGVPPGTRVGDYPLPAVVDCPHVLDVANHPAVLGLAHHYLGFRPTLTGIGLRWSFPNASSPADNVQQFHRDAEPGSIKLLVYLTDVDDASGPHHYVPGTHRERMSLRLKPYADTDVRRRYGTPRAVTGPAGTAFMIDAKGIHRGVPPLARPRLVLVAEYSLLPCLLYDYAPVPCRGGERFDPYVNRLVISAAPQPLGKNSDPAPPVFVEEG